ncbi:DNA polymerase/3'-5' exonuclease PolX [Lentibacillus halophilus]|uniref:DNA-directed DNA polymerase n=1 Tax=Lentibacillus halophilus TaxID=295065 RepID=A0ABP3IVI1_9BACI
MTVNKKDVIKLLERIALYLELKGDNPYKISAYQKAAQALERDDRSIADIDDVTKIKGIGKGTGAVIAAYIENGTSETLTELEKEIPEGLLPLLNVPGLGGKKLSKIYHKLEVTDADSLKQACENGQIESLEGFGKKSAEKIIAALDEVNKRPERLPIAYMLPLAERVEQYLDTIHDISDYSRAGSLRRFRETVRDIDFIIASEHPASVRDQLLELDRIKEVIANGETKVSLVLADAYDVNVDFRIVAPEEFATTLHHFTGSKDHNVAMRQLAKSNGEKINEYGVESEESGDVVTFVSEEQLFRHLGLHYIPPELRENTGEVESFHESVSLLEQRDILGDLHMHTTWSDGGQSIEEMVNRARNKQYHHIAITDHSKFLRVANGLNETRLRRQREEINRLNDKYDDIHIFAGVEMDILPDGSLDFDDAFLQEMDFVIGAIHSSFQQSQDEIMNRLFAALENPNVSLIAHPTGRLIGRRQGYHVDIDRLIERAAETGTALEINANPNRLDLSSQWTRRAQEAGTKIAINTDAHDYDMLDHMTYGVSTARKGWLNKETVLNTWSVEKLKAFMNRDGR